MILAQKNPLAFHSDVTRQLFNTTGNVDVLIFYALRTMPQFQLMTSSATFGSILIYDTNHNLLSTAIPMQYEFRDGYYVVSPNVSGDISSYLYDEDLGSGWYYLKVINGSDIYYSSVFAWTDDYDSLIKFSIQSTPIALGINKEYETNDLSYDFYLYAEENAPEVISEEDAEEDNGNVIPSYVGASYQNVFILDGNKYIYKFLSFIRVLSVNGSITLEWEGIEYDANDVLVDIKESYNGNDLIDIELKFISSSDVATVINKR